MRCIVAVAALAAVTAAELGFPKPEIGNGGKGFGIGTGIGTGIGIGNRPRIGPSGGIGKGIAHSGGVVEGISLDGLGSGDRLGSRPRSVAHAKGSPKLRHDSFGGKLPKGNSFGHDNKVHTKKVKEPKERKTKETKVRTKTVKQPHQKKPKTSKLPKTKSRDLPEARQLAPPRMLHRPVAAAARTFWDVAAATAYHRYGYRAPYHGHHGAHHRPPYHGHRPPHAGYRPAHHGLHGEHHGGPRGPPPPRGASPPRRKLSAPTTEPTVQRTGSEAAALPLPLPELIAEEDIFCQFE